MIDGHPDDRFGRPAVFWPLSRLRAGDRIIVRTEESDLVFTVTAVASCEVAHFPRLAVFGPALQPQLNLITCAGAWDRGRRAYTRREIIFARLLPTTRSPHRWRPL